MEELLATSFELQDISEMEGKYLTFFMEEQLYGMEIAAVVQIVGIQEITAIPEFPYYAKGIMNLRGNMIPVIDMRLRIGKVEVPYDERTCIIVTQVRESTVGFIVDAVDAVTEIKEDTISSPPEIAGTVSDGYLRGLAKHEGKVVLLLDIAKVLSETLKISFSAEDREER